MRRVRFPPSPTGSLHIGNALTAAANGAFGKRSQRGTQYVRQILEPEPVELPEEARPTLERGPELWTVTHALPRDEAMRRVDAAL